MQCNTCALANRVQKTCCLKGIPIDLEKDYCSKHTTSLNTCEICGSAIVPGTELIECDETGKPHIYCRNCLTFLKSCASCPKQYCAFNEDPDPMPKIVIREVRQGNMVMKGQVINEERVKMFCTSCHCWSTEFGCLKKLNHGCDKKPNFWSSRKS